MTRHRTHRVVPTYAITCSLVSSALAGCGESPVVAATTSGLVAVCSESEAEVPTDAWLCPNDLTIECLGENGTGDVDAIYYVALDPTCDELDVVVDDPGPFSVGTHTVSVMLGDPDASSAPLCSAELEVVDTEAPIATPHEVVLWPPNHRSHAVSPDDCVTVLDRCDGILHAQFTWASSDEPENEMGDGDTGPDIDLASDGASFRAERQGGGDGRVYRLGFVAADAAGHEVEGSCTVVVPHDQSGSSAVEGVAAYTHTL